MLFHIFFIFTGSVYFEFFGVFSLVYFEL